MRISQIIESLGNVFYPQLCLVCQEKNVHHGTSLCISCQHKLPKTNFHLEKKNRFTERFEGRIPLENGTALYLYKKGGLAADLIHQLKYKGRKEIGLDLGRHYGDVLLQNAPFRDIDLIIPVPLHPMKERKRGYNQSNMFAQGLSEKMAVPWLRNGLMRDIYTETQTKKGSLERLENVLEIFVVTNPDLVAQKHILLVDDVMTTGATLEACALPLLAIPNTKVSMATIAISEF